MSMKALAWNVSIGWTGGRVRNGVCAEHRAAPFFSALGATTDGRGICGAKRSQRFFFSTYTDRQTHTQWKTSGRRQRETNGTRQPSGSSPLLEGREKPSPLHFFCLRTVKPARGSASSSTAMKIHTEHRPHGGQPQGPVSSSSLTPALALQPSLPPLPQLPQPPALDGEMALSPEVVMQIVQISSAFLVTLNSYIASTREIDRRARRLRRSRMLLLMRLMQLRQRKLRDSLLPQMANRRFGPGMGPLRSFPPTPAASASRYHQYRLRFVRTVRSDLSRDLCKIHPLEKSIVDQCS